MEAHTGGLRPRLPVATDQMEKPEQDLASWPCHSAGSADCSSCPEARQGGEERLSPDLPTALTESPPLPEQSHVPPGAQRRHGAFNSPSPPGRSLLMAQKQGPPKATDIVSHFPRTHFFL